MLQAQGPFTSAPASSGRGSIAFLFLGELFLIPHLLPIALALARQPSAPRITLYVITSVHEEIIGEALVRLRLPNVRVRRAIGFRRFPPGTRETPHLPFKLLVLALNGLRFLRHDVVVVTERTSLWLPRVAKRGARFIYNEHGAAPHANFASQRNHHAARLLMPGPGMAERARAYGGEKLPVETVGYIKRDYVRELSPGELPCFQERRPTLLYAPHWLREKSSWWSIGEEVLEHFARSSRYNLILAPHLRLPEADPEFERRVRRFRDCPNIHIDARSFRLVDQSYIRNADIYLGDGSSQVVEFAERPRPVLFLNPDRIEWRHDPRFSHWTMGDVVETLDELDRALEIAPAAHAAYAPVQRRYVERMMGVDDGCASLRAAATVMEVLAEARTPAPRPTMPRRWRRIGVRLTPARAPAAPQRLGGSPVFPAPCGSLCAGRPAD